MPDGADKWTWPLILALILPIMHFSADDIQLHWFASDDPDETPRDDPNKILNLEIEGLN